MSKKYMMRAEDVMEVLGVSRRKAYHIINDLNLMLEKDGYWVQRGKIPRPYFEEKMYGFTKE